MVELKSRTAPGIMGPANLIEGILDTAMEAVIMVDESHCITIFNRSAETIFGYATEDVIGRPLSILFHDLHVSDPSESHRPVTTLASIIRSTGSKKGLRITALRSNGERFPAEVSVCRFGQAGPLTFAFCLNDITERQLLETHLFESERLKAQEVMVGAMAHDFNNMLCAIISYTHLAQNVLGPQSKPRHYLDQVRKAAEEAERLVRKLINAVQPHD